MLTSMRQTGLQSLVQKLRDGLQEMAPASKPQSAKPSTEQTAGVSKRDAFVDMRQRAQVVALLGQPAASPAPSVAQRGGTNLFQEFKRRLHGASLQPAAVTPSPLQPLTLSGSVGAGGKNRPADVAQVQRALSGLGVLAEGFTPGRMDQATKQAIRTYQTQNELPVVDGRIDVNRSTMRDINQRIVQSTSQPTSPTRPVTPQSPTHPAPVTPDTPRNPTVDTPAPTNNITPAPTNNITPAPTNTVDAPGRVEHPRGVSPATDTRLQEVQQRALTSARQEWQNGVRERGGANRGPRVDDYARAARMRPGGEWCGYFTGFNYDQQGFQHTSSLASYQKARDFFMYRNYTKRNNDPANRENDTLRAQHRANGDGRQYFMLEESPTIHRVTRRGTWGRARYGHFDAAANTFQHQNLPIRGGDTVLFNRGHVGMVESYDPASGRLVTIEGNATGMGANGRRRSQAVVRKEYDLSNPAVRRQFDGFGRPALQDFAS